MADPSGGAQTIALAALLFALGATVGSFLNVVIFRLPRRESLIRPGSRCLSCGQRLGALDLVPVLSYLLLRGRCRHCGRGFSPRYMLVELATGLLCVAAWQTFALTWPALLVFVAACCLIVIFFIDLDHYIIPDEAVIIIACAGVALDLLQLLARGAPAAICFVEHFPAADYHLCLPRSLVGLVVGGGVFLAITFVSDRIFKKPSMGGGDIKLAAAMGAALGPGYQFLSYFLLSVGLGVVVAVGCMALGRRGRRDYIPFGPMMAAAGIAMLYWGDLITPAVMSVYGR